MACFCHGQGKKSVTKKRGFLSRTGRSKLNNCFLFYCKSLNHLFYSAVLIEIEFIDTEAAQITLL